MSSIVNSFKINCSPPAIIAGFHFLKALLYRGLESDLTGVACELEPAQQKVDHYQLVKSISILILLLNSLR